MHTMTDAELLELVQTKLPQELSGEEIALLRERIRHNPEFRQSVAEHLELERYLGDSFAKVKFSADQILARARPEAGAVRGRFRRAVLLMMAVVVLGAVGVSWYLLAPAGAEKVSDTGPNPSGAVALGTMPSSSRPVVTRPTAPVPTTKETGKAVEPPPPPPDPKPVVVEAPANSVSPYALVEPLDTGLSEEELKAWFVAVDGYPHNFRHQPANWQQGAFTEMNGLWRLRPTWKDETSLRLLFRTVNPWKLYLWNGQEGIALEVWRGDHRFPVLPDLSLIAYRATRKGNGPRPDTLVIGASDEGEYWRTRTGHNLGGFPRLASTTIDLRQENGILTASWGDVVLLRVPMAKHPTEVFFEGEGALQSLGFAPPVPLPPDPAGLPIVLDQAKPAELPWVGDAANLQKRDDGSVVLVCEKNPNRVAIGTPLPRQGIVEMTLELDGVMPGTGVFLGDEKGQPRYLATFLREQTTGRTILVEQNPGDNASDMNLPPNSRWPVAYVPEKTWVRILMACGQMKCWVSSDGTHWFRAFDPVTGRPAEFCSTIGLFGQPGDKAHSLQLRRVTLRELSSLNALAPAKLVADAPLIPHNLYSPFSEWLAGAEGYRPADVDANVWARACAIRALASGVCPAQGMTMLENLLDHGLDQPLPVEAKLRLLDEALSLAPKSGPPIPGRFVQFYDRIGRSLQLAGDPHPFSRLRQSLYHAPLWSAHVIDLFPESLATEEMLDLAAAGQADETEMLARWGRVHRMSPSRFDWAEGHTLPKGLKVRGPRQKKLALPQSWKAPTQLDATKENRVDMEEVEAALAAGSFHEVGLILSRLKVGADFDRRTGRLFETGLGGKSPTELSMLVPDSTTNQRLTSWSVFAHDIFDKQPEVRGILRKDFGPEARLKLRLAMDEKDEAALEALVIRYPGTEEAAEALLWRGDRYLLDGEPAFALMRYREARRITEGGLRDALEDRMIVATALLGRKAPAVDHDIQLGDVRLTAASLEALRKRRQEDGYDSRDRQPLPAQLAPSPSTFTLAPREKLDGEMGSRPETIPVIPYGGFRLDIDWIARQLAVSIDGNRMYVNNRFQVDCYELPSGKRLWRSALSRDGNRKEIPGQSYDYGLIAMRPLVVGNKIYVRRLLQGPPLPNNVVTSVPTLACLNADNGNVEWMTTNHLKGRIHYLSDPVMMQNQLFVLGYKKADDGEMVLTLFCHNPRDGSLIAERSLSPLGAAFEEQRSCQLTVTDDTMLATVGGSIFGLDLTGTVRWMRRPLWAPTPTDPYWLQQVHETPVIVGDRAYVVQPGVLNLTCLAVDSGKAHWQKTVSGLRRLLGVFEKRIIVQTETGFVSLDPATGAEQWRHEAARLQPLASLCGGPAGLMYARTEAMPNDKERLRVRLVWLDLETGKEKASWALPGLQNSHPRFGPIVTTGDHLFAFTGMANEPNRELVELVPGPAEPPAAVPLTEWGQWTRNVPRPLQGGAEKVFPDWLVFDARPTDQAGLAAEYKGKANVLCAPAHFLIGRHLDVPDSEKPRLLLRVVNAPGSQSKMIVRVDGKVLWSQDFNEANDWKDLEIDLTAYKGKRVWVVINQAPLGGDTGHCYWQAIEVVK